MQDWATCFLIKKVRVWAKKCGIGQKRCEFKQFIFLLKKVQNWAKKVRVWAIYFLVKKGARWGKKVQDWAIYFSKKKRCEFGQKRCGFGPQIILCQIGDYPIIACSRK